MFLIQNEYTEPFSQEILVHLSRARNIIEIYNKKILQQSKPCFYQEDWQKGIQPSAAFCWKQDSGEQMPVLKNSKTLGAIYSILKNMEALAEIQKDG